MRLKRKSNAEGKRRFFPLLWTAGLASAAIVALGVSGTLAQFVASITNTQNHVQTAGPEAFGFAEYLVLGPNDQRLCARASAGQEVTCPGDIPDISINKYGQNGAAAQPIAPGAEMRTTVRLQNDVQQSTPGGLSGNLGFEVGPCENVPVPVEPTRTPGNLCNTVTVEITCNNAAGAGAFHWGPVTLQTLSNESNLGTPVAGRYSIATAIPPEGYVDCTFDTVFPRGATATDLQDVRTDQELTWTWTQV